MADRTFFGSYEVSVAGERHTLRHGTTIHGWQQWPDRAADLTPTTYYSRSGPLGDVMASTEADPARSLGFIGLGIGTALSYVRPDDSAQVVEIDPVMVEIAADTQWFTYLAESGDDTEVFVGDGRIVLRDQLSDASFDVLAVDAFSSDAIPVHLLTREALALYLDRTAEDGMVALHLSNRHLDLVPVTAELARDADAHAAVRVDSQAEEPNSTGSTWVVVSRSPEAVETLLSSGWESLADVEGPLWTDDVLDRDGPQVGRRITPSRSAPGVSRESSIASIVSSGIVRSTGPCPYGQCYLTVIRTMSCPVAPYLSVTTRR